MKKKLFVFTLSCLVIAAPIAAQKVGINKTNPAEALDVNGNIKADTLKVQSLRITANAGNNKILRSDANGNGTWATLPVSNGGTSLDSAYNFGGAGSGASINAISGPVVVRGTDGFQVTGINASGADLLLAGAGSRLFFYPKKSAFRAGAVSGNTWNRDSIGEFSFAVGNSTSARGTAAAALGQAAIASGAYSLAWGSFTAATATYSTAGGYSSAALAPAATALGNYSKAMGFYSTAIGNYTIANGNGSLVIGSYNDTVVASTTSIAITPATPLFIIGNGSAATGRSNAMVVKYNGSVGIGTNNPASRLEVNANTGPVIINGTDGLQVTGAFATGLDLGLSGAGTRMFFYPKKAAFRAGHVTVNNWNKDSIGNYSFAGGYNPIAKGNYAIALGTSASAQGEYATALGYAPLATGSSAIAIGFQVKSSGNNSTGIGNYAEARATYSTAIGNSAIASGTYAVSLGNGTTASGENALATGYGSDANGFGSTSTGVNTNASGSYSTAMGNNCIALGDNAFAAGAFSNATGINSVSIGNNNTASGARSVCFGENNFASSSNCLVLGRFNDSIAGSNASTWVATDPLLIVGNGATAASRHNAFVIYKNGNGEIDGAFAPAVGNAYALGKNNKKWSEVWATNGVIQTSDARLKKDIEPLQYGLQTILQLKPVSYNWKDGTAGRQVGFIAQDVLQVLPEAVVITNPAEPLGMKYVEMIPVLTKAIQEQQVLINTLQQQVLQLKQMQQPAVH